MMCFYNAASRNVYSQQVLKERTSIQTHDSTHLSKISQNKQGPATESTRRAIFIYNDFSKIEKINNVVPHNKCL